MAAIRSCIMSAWEPLTWADLDEDERRAVVMFRKLPPHRRPAMRRFALRLMNGVPAAKAERLVHQDVAVADARRQAGSHLNTGPTPTG